LLDFGWGCVIVTESQKPITLWYVPAKAQILTCHYSKVFLFHTWLEVNLSVLFFSSDQNRSVIFHRPLFYQNFAFEKCTFHLQTETTETFSLTQTNKLIKYTSARSYTLFQIKMPRWHTPYMLGHHQQLSGNTVPHPPQWPPPQQCCSEKMK